MMFNSYFSALPILKKGAIMNLVTSDRSDGKTFDIKLRSLADFYLRNEINIVCRRYKTEMKKTFYGNFFGEILSKNNEEIKGIDELGLTFEMLDEIRTWKFTYSRETVEVDRGNGKKEIIIIFSPLTMSGKVKSMFNDYYKQIHYINVDEYVPLDGRYLEDEAELLLELWKSIDRDRILDPNQKRTQLICLGNKMTPFVPLLDYYDIELSLLNDKVRTYRNGTFAVQVYSSKEHREKRETSPLADLIKGTRYEGYDKGGILRTLNLKIKTRDNAEIWLSFITSKGEGTIWYNEGQFIVSCYTRKDKPYLVDKPYNKYKNEINIKAGLFGKTIKKAYYVGNMYFENDKAFHIFEDILKKA